MGGSLDFWLLRLAMQMSLVVFIAGRINATAKTNSWAVQVEMNWLRSMDLLINQGTVGPAKEFNNRDFYYLLQIGCLENVYQQEYQFVMPVQYKN